MEKKKKNWLHTALLALAAAGVLTLLAGLGALENADLALSDIWYRDFESQDGDIVLVKIDQQAIEEIGPYQQWGRDIIAMALEYLNESEDCHPAAIAVDILYAGETDPDTDQWLAEAAAEYGNVITGCLAEIGTETVWVAGDYQLVPSYVREFEEPYDALREAATLGHINAMLDGDGVLRHHMLSLLLPDGREIPSMALAAANMYREFYGQEPVELPPTDSRGFWYLPLCGGPEAFSESISVADLLNGTVPADYFAGKIVLIGAYVPALQDDYITAADHAHSMYGVEFQANAVQALLWGKYKQEVGNRVQLAVLFGLLLAGFFCFWRRSVRFSTAVLVIFCAGWLGLCRWAFEMGWVLHVLWVPAGAAVLYVVSLAANYIHAAIERRKITGTFQRYVAPEIVRELLKEGEALDLGGKQVNIAVLFVDVRGFTPMSELLEPAQVVEILNRYLTLISDCIFRHGGTLDKFVGDAAMAFWGAPLPQEDYVMLAARAAMDMVDGSQALSEELMKKYGRTVSFGVGIHTGEAVVGNIGSLRRMDYTAIGDTVNTAARLEANAPGGTVYISRAVADALGERIQTTSLGSSIKLKGKKEGFEVLTLDKIN